MTGASNVKLLPPPKWLLEGFTDPTIERLCDYARANVAHATAPLQAEIEALRAEAIEWRGLFDMAKARADKAEARAERMAEALREMLVFYGERVDAECRTKDW